MSDINVEIFTTRTRRTNSSPSLPSESLATEPAVQPSVPSVSTFIGLSDTPSTYSGQANKITAVNSGETGLQFISVGDITNGFVPYTGANQNVNLGTNTITANSFITNSGTSSQFVKGDGSLDSNTYALASALGNYQLLSEKGTANGYASLDSNGKVPLTQINDALLGNVNFQGLWNASTNTPTLVNPPASSTKGHYYIVSTAGTFASIDFEVGDWIISNGSTWNKVDNTDAVSSVFGRTGNVTAQESDYQDFYPRLSQSYNNPSWINSLAWSKITGTPTTLSGYGITDAVPSNRTLTINGTSFDLSANRTWTIPTHDAVTLGTANGLSLSGQVLSLGLASSTTTGALSSTDWNTFNNKENAFTKNTAFNKNFGTTAGTVAEGNDSRILNGQTAFTWGNHASAGYVTLAGEQTITGFKTFSGSFRGVNFGWGNHSSYRDTINLGSTGDNIARYILVAPFSTGTTGQVSAGVAGWFFIDRGSSAASNVTENIYISIKTAWSSTVLKTFMSNRQLDIVTFNSINYVAILVNSAASRNVSFQGNLISQSGWIPQLVDASDCTVVTSNWRTAGDFLWDGTPIYTTQNLTNPVTGTGANGRVAFWTGTNTQSSDAGFTWDNTNKVLSITGTDSTGQFNIRNSFVSGSPIQAFLRNSGGDVNIGNERTAFNLNLLNGNTIRWSILSTGILQSNGAQTIQTSTGNLTLATAGGNGNILLSPNGTGFVQINKTTDNETFTLLRFNSARAWEFRTINSSTTTSLNLVDLTGGKRLNIVSGTDGNTIYIQPNIRTISCDTGDLRIQTDANNNHILLSPNGTGAVFINTTTALTGGGRLQVNGQLNVATVNNATGDFLTHVNGIVNKRTASQVLTDIGAQASLGFTPENVANKSTSTTLGTSDTLYPTQNAVKSYVDTGLATKANTNQTMHIGTTAVTINRSAEAQTLTGVSIDGSSTGISSTSPQLAAAVESNSIFVTSPSYTIGQITKPLIFDWYGNYWAIGNIRSSSTPSSGFGIGFQSNTPIHIFTTTGLSINGNTAWHSGNLTNPITGTGTRTANFVSKFSTDTNQITNSQIFDNGTNVGINNTNPSSKLFVKDSLSENPSLLVLEGLNNGRGLEIKLGTDGLGAVGSAVIYNTRVSLPYGEHIWQQSGVNRMCLDSSGNLGLGVTPSAWGNEWFRVLQLGNNGAHIGGVTSSYSSSPLLLIGNNSYLDSADTHRYILSRESAQYRQQSGQHAWYTAPSGTAGQPITFTQAMTLTAGGNLGIGTNSLSEKLRVRAGGTFQSEHDIIRWQNDNDGGSEFAAGVLGYDNPGSSPSVYIGAKSNTALRFKTNDTERLRITSGGELLVGGTSNAAGGIIQAIGSSSTALSIRSTNPSGGQPTLRFFHDGNDEFLILGGSSLRFLSSGTNERMRITSGGNLGINNTSPDSRMHIINTVSAGTNNYILELQNTTTAADSRAGILLATNSGTGTSRNGASIQASNNGVTGEANILFGTVLSDAFSTKMTLLSNGNLSVTGDVIAFSSSDARLKDNLTKIDNSLEKINKLGGYSFTWNDKQDAYKGDDYGVVAQEVEALFPEMVTTRDNGYKAVKYEKLIPVLIEAVKELSKEVNELKGGK